MYEKYKLSELVKIKYGKNQKKVVSEFGDIPIYGTGGLMGYATKYLYNKPSVLIGRKGSIGKVKYVEHPFWTVDTLFYTEVNDEIVIPRYLFYKMSLIDLNIYNEGTTIPSLRTETLNRLVFKIPSIKEQLKILNIIKPIDDKIELNNKINKNLEEMAQAIFKSWFVDFEPWGGEMPDDWVYGNIESLSKQIICGKTPPTKIKEYYGKDIPFITIPDMHDNTYIINTIRYLSKKGCAYQSKKTLPKNTICVSCIGSAGLVSLTSEDSQTNQQINSIIPKSNISPYFVYFLLKSYYHKINAHGASGSTFCNLNKSQFSKLQCIIPNDTSLSKFERFAKPIFDKILINKKQNKNLTKLKDTLLPKLMSGELDVSNLEI